MDKLSRIHIKSFDFLLKDGIKRMIKYIQPYEFIGPNNDLYELLIEFIEFSTPNKMENKSVQIYPHECRRQGLTYGAELKLSVRVRINGEQSGIVEVPCGELPIMVLSRNCNLSRLRRCEFAKHFEEEKEIGGYFIVNGKERVLRLLIMTRRNYPIALSRPSFKKRGHGYTEHAVILHSVREDETTSNLILHWLMNGEPALAFVVEREQFFVPISILLRALVDKTEFEMFDDIRRGSGESLSLEETAMRILVRLKDDDYSSQSRALSYLGRLFRGRMYARVNCSDAEAGSFLLQEFVAIHLNSFVDKYHILCFMIRKLHTFVSGQCCEENNDNLMFQEVLLPSTLYIQVLRDKILQLIRGTKEYMNVKSRGNKVRANFTMVHQSLLARASEVGLGLNYLLSTGNLPPSTRASLSAQFNGQSTGLSVPADNVNFLRLAAQFRAVHRGAAFVDSRTTSVRRLLPEAWGFICPVHTPDGAPCGLLNHLAEPVEAVCDSPKQSSLDALAAWLSNAKLRPVELSRQLSHLSVMQVQQQVLPVLLDGRLLGWCACLADAQRLANELRGLKLNAQSRLVPYTLEVVLVPPTDVGSQYPGLFLFTGGSRLLRPVRNLVDGNQSDASDGGGLIEWIGTFEQPYLDIAVNWNELMERPVSRRFHMEITPDNIFSFVAGLTPYQDFNQSPRNMYQCQMAKQTMGHSCYTWRYRADAKAYRLLTPQSPLVRTKTYVKYDMDHYPIGFNAIVAVMSYTGYDMEDAMVINKGSYERGLAGACIYKSEVLDLSQLSKTSGSRTQPFGRRKTPISEYYFGTPSNQPLPAGLDIDGFPPVGTCLQPGSSPLYAYTHIETQKVTIVRYEGGEQIAYVDAITLNGSWSQATITLRLPRPPDIGDKYSSRHGQKGINSLLVPSEEMPWTVSGGIVPDLIFNPHGFPTRMTMGMMVEFLAGKSACLTGTRVDATPFQWTEKSPPYLDYCQQLADSGFNYWGTETMMSGCNGRQLEAHIYIGVIYYQRLRHMVADKYQVRAEGRFDPILRQPIKGRKVGGGIRLGEMERDCLLSQGLSFTLQDRMVESNSDTVTMLACSKCGSLIHTDLTGNLNRNSESNSTHAGLGHSRDLTHGSYPFDREHWSCRLCDDEESISSSTSSSELQNKSHLKRVRVSAAFRYLTYELACLNVRTQLVVNDIA